MKIITRGHMEARRLTLKLVDGTVLTGMINLIQRGETEHRVSDIFVGREEPFVVIFQSSMGEMTNKTLVINKRHILWVMPEELDSHEQKVSAGREMYQTDLIPAD